MSLYQNVVVCSSTLLFDLLLLLSKANFVVSLVSQASLWVGPVGEDYQKLHHNNYIVESLAVVRWLLRVFICVFVCQMAGLAARISLLGIQLTTPTCAFAKLLTMHSHLTMQLHSIMLTVHSNLTMYWLDNADNAFTCQVDHAFTP